MTFSGIGAGINELTALAVTSELAPTRKRGQYVAVLGPYYHSVLPISSLGSAHCLPSWLEVLRRSLWRLGGLWTTHDFDLLLSSSARQFAGALQNAGAWTD